MTFKSIGQVSVCQFILKQFLNDHKDNQAESDLFAKIRNNNLILHVIIRTNWISQSVFWDSHQTWMSDFLRIIRIPSLSSGCDGCLAICMFHHTQCNDPQLKIILIHYFKCMCYVLSFATFIMSCDLDLLYPFNALFHLLSDHIIDF